MFTKDWTSFGKVIEDLCSQKPLPHAKEIEIKFLGLGYNKFYQANIWIYDSNNNLVYKGKTYNSKINICLKKNKLYKLKATSLNENINTCFYVSNLDSYIFIFDRAKNTIRQNRKITFLLTDYYYNNLPIEKGELYLWQK